VSREARCCSIPLCPRHFLQKPERDSLCRSIAITEESVQVHLRNMFAKLNVNDRTAALTVAVRRGSFT
jgi:hypothetical protein